jgi:NTP pyrophosphatase (non-canonical NTP hydrolase)
MPELMENARLHDFQIYVSELERERGFSLQTAKDKCLLIGEEIGELFKVIRKSEGIAIDPSSKINDIGDEIADIFIYLCSIANRFDINIEQAFIKKEEKNKQRKWMKQ